MTTKAKGTKRTQVSAAVEAPLLQVEPSWGLAATIHEGYLQIRQEDNEGNADTIMLSRADAQALVKTFPEWWQV